MAIELLDTLGVPLLEQHWKVVVLSTISWHVLFLLGRWGSNKYIPLYKTWDKTTGLGVYICATINKSIIVNGRIRFASFLNAIIVCALAFGILLDPVMYNNKLWSYTQYSGDVMAIILGYFIWDIYVSFQIGDPGFIIHGLSAFMVYFLSFKPFIMYYGAVFILYELSTPFLNIHWMCDKLGMTGVSFYNQFEKIPLHLVVAYTSLNLVLNGLNIFWFFKMIDSVRRRFAPGGKTQKFGESGSSGFSSSKKERKKE
ncbi:UNVERIFIED_CONTAM: hypothetical protein HDU68_006922 [Siphonaria sp. JEL0065]|nr:hypothetical protein HDU68_006922 [Siphonaria sp. JEL0065]